ncbi:MAG: orotate phosphoribosyltransferase [Nitrospirae bacterium 13_2_20CM_2_62_8]|nr:MAG: orotate phosphoribosyltransferase [Nitrospirae bacterium 13_2_20CM_2_62_8]
MMGKLAVLLSIVFACVQAASALAGMNPDTGPGCGLGKLAWSDYKQQKHVGPQVLMGTTNWLPIPSQPFAISFGTSGCTNDKKFWAEEKAKVFAQISFDNLSQEMAQGQGEHLASLATLMGVPAEHQAEFFAMTQERYLALIQAGDGSPAAMVEALHEAITHHPVLAKLATSR